MITINLWDKIGDCIHKFAFSALADRLNCGDKLYIFITKKNMISFYSFAIFSAWLNQRDWQQWNCMDVKWPEQYVHMDKYWPKISSTRGGYASLLTWRCWTRMPLSIKQQKTLFYKMVCFLWYEMINHIYLRYI